MKASTVSSGGAIVVAVVLGPSGTDAVDALAPSEVFARELQGNLAWAEIVPQNNEMSSDDAVPWHGPNCPQCGTELDVEPIAIDQTIRVGYICSTHGLVSIADPLDNA